MKNTFLVGVLIMSLSASEYIDGGAWQKLIKKTDDIKSVLQFNSSESTENDAPGPAATSIFKGMTNCIGPNTDCNYCVNDVHRQFKRLGKMPNGDRKPSARIRIRARENESLPPFPMDFLPRLDNDLHQGNHVQGINRLPGSDHRWIAISAGTPKKREDLSAGFILAHLGDIPGNSGDRFLSPRQNRDTYKDNPSDRRAFEYFYPVGGADTNPTYTTSHPGGIQLVGNLLFVPYKARETHQGYIDIWNVAVPSRAKLLQTVPLPHWRNDQKRTGALYVAATRLANGKFLMLVNRGDKGQMSLFMSNTDRISAGTAWKKISDPDFSAFSDWYAGACKVGFGEKMAYQNANFVTDCSTGDLYLLAMRQKCGQLLKGGVFWNANNSVHLFKFELNVDQQLKLQKVDAIQPNGESEDWCEMRGGSGIYVTPTKEMILYCSRGIVGKKGNLKFSEHTVN